MESIGVGIGIVSQWVRAVSIHLDTVGQAVIISVIIFKISPMNVVLRPILQSIGVTIGEVEALVCDLITIVVNSIQSLVSPRIYIWIIVVTILEMIEQIIVGVGIVIEWISTPIIHLDAVGQAIVIAVRI